MQLESSLNFDYIDTTAKSCNNCRKSIMTLIDCRRLATESLHLEFALEDQHIACTHSFRKNIDTLERIQRRATKMIPELRDLSYEERLKECGLTTLETRRLRRDQIEVSKILNGYENIDRNMLYSLKKDSKTRGHEVKLSKGSV